MCGFSSSCSAAGRASLGGSHEKKEVSEFAARGVGIRSCEEEDSTFKVRKQEGRRLCSGPSVEARGSRLPQRQGTVLSDWGDGRDRVAVGVRFGEDERRKMADSG